MCFQAGGSFLLDTSLPFSLRWVTASCQDTTCVITSNLNSQGLSLQATLGHLGLIKAKHKASPLSQCMVRLWLEFNSVTMTNTIPQPKLADIADLVAAWSTRS